MQSVSRPRPYHHAYNTHISVPLQLPSKQGYAETDSSGPLPLAYVLSFHPLPTHLRPQLLFALAHLALGARLRVSSEVRESLAVTGLGYLVGFDHIVDARRRRNVEEKALGSPFRASAPVKEGVCAHQPRPSPASSKSPTCSFPPSTSNNSVTMPPFPPRARSGQYLHRSSLGSRGRGRHEQNQAACGLIDCCYLCVHVRQLATRQSRVSHVCNLLPQSPSLRPLRPGPPYSSRRLRSAHSPPLRPLLPHRALLLQHTQIRQHHYARYAPISKA